ncbi:MAG: lysylphosphatidylglycerol synthase transmembrane domain-containing protein [Candidatus Methanofastidiosia archaeon]
MVPKYLEKHRTRITLIIFVPLLLLIILIVGPSEIVNALKNIDKRYFILAVLLYAGSIIIGALRWDRIIDITEYSSKFKTILQFSIIDKFANSFFPTSAAGMAIRSILLEKEYKIPKSIGLATTVLDYGIDTLGTFLLAVPCFFLLKDDLPNSLMRTFQTGIITIAIVVLLVFVIGSSKTALEKFGAVISRTPIKRKKITHKFIEFSKTFRLAVTSPKISFQTVLLTFCKVIVDAVRITILFRAFGIYIPFYYFILFDSAWVFLAPLMFTPGGIGVVESGRIAMFSLIPHINKSAVVSVVFIDRLITFWFMIVVGAVVFFYSGIRTSMKNTL